MPLFEPTGGSTSSTLRPKRATSPSSRAISAIASSSSTAAASSSRWRKWNATDSPFSSISDGGHAAAPAKSAICCRQRSAWRSSSSPCEPTIDDAVDGDALAHVVAGAAADDGDERVAADEPRELRARLGGRIRVLGTLDDRREHAVEVEKEACFPGRRGQTVEQRVRRQRPPS